MMIVGTATSAVTQILDQKAPLWSTSSYSVSPAKTEPPTSGVRCRLSQPA